MELLGVSFISSGKLTHAGVGFLQIDVNQGWHLAKTKTFSRGVGLHVFKQLTGRFIRQFHSDLTVQKNVEDILTG